MTIRKLIIAVCILLSGGFSTLRAQDASPVPDTSCESQYDLYAAIPSFDIPGGGEAGKSTEKSSVKSSLVSWLSNGFSGQAFSVPTYEDGWQPSRFALKTNGLYLLGAIPNIGVEFNLGKGWTLTADWMYAWWYNDPKHIYWQTYGGYFGFRRYFGQSAQERPFTGHHIGAYGSMLTYDFEWGGRGYQAARWGFGGGVEYGYSIALSQQLNLDLAIGFGYQDGEYKEYDPIDGHYVWQGTYLRNWIGPTKATVALVWTIGSRNKKQNQNQKKGGDQ